MFTVIVFLLKEISSVRSYRRGFTLPDLVGIPTKDEASEEMARPSGE